LGSAKVLSEAILKIPLHIAVFQGHGEKQRKLIEEMFIEFLSDLPSITFLARIEKEVIGVMRMKSCESRKVPDVHPQIEDINYLNWRIFFWHRKWARNDPLDPHWHLGPVGVLPSHQGRGVGTELLKRFFYEVDACSAPAYLETDTHKNVQFYERFDFQVSGESEIFGVNNHYMWRDPQM